MGWIVGALAAAALAAGAVLRLVKNLWPAAIPAWATVLIDNPLRWWLEPPAAVVKAAALAAGMRVLEVGPGYGTYTVPLARALGATGTLDAVDLQPKVVRNLDRRLKRAAVANVVTHVAPAYKLPFASQVFDRAAMVGVLGEIPDRGRALREVARVLRDDGFIVVGEFFVDPDYRTPGAVRRYAAAAGCEVADVFRAPLSYVAVLKKRTAP